MSKPILQAILTKYMGATNTRGSRIRATSASGENVSVPLDYSLNTEDAHAAAAQALMDKMKWSADWDWVQGSTKDGYAFVLVPKGRASNPAPRIGAAKPRRKSQVTGEKPSMRLVQRREKNTRKGYYPNPIEGDSHGLRYIVAVKESEKSDWKNIAVFSRADGEDGAKAYAKKVAKKHPSWSVSVRQE